MSSVIAITPARDEEKLLPGLIASMAAHTHPPERWIVIDDGSVDATAKIVDAAASRYAWIEPHHLPRNRARAAGGESVVMQFLPREQWDRCDYFLRLDADITFREDFIESLLTEFRRDTKLGVAGPILLESDGAQWREIKVPSFHVRGAAKMFTAKCFSAIGGQDAGPGFDTIDELHAMMLGFRSRHFSRIRAFHHRPQGTAGSLWRARLAAGRAAYRSGYSTLFLMVRAAHHLLTPPRLLGSAMMLAGYFEGYLRRWQRQGPPELTRFVRRQQLRRLLMLDTVWR
jgi:glycosyltransferase involved in cell wall biosynthesis